MKLEKSNAKYKTAADKKIREKVFKEKDMIMIYLRGKKKRNHLASYNKLKSRRYKLFKIGRKINDNTYDVDFPSDMKMFKKFNVANL